MNIKDLKHEITPVNNPDWDYARTQRVSLRRPQGEWTSSAFSVPLNIETLFGLSKYVVPNRDFRYEGFFSIVSNENWKFLEALPVGIFAKGEWLELRSKKVEASPWKVVYKYEYLEPNSNIALGFLKVEYYLMSGFSGHSVLSVEISLEPRENTEQECLLLLDPLVKIRHMYDSENPTDLLWNSEYSSSGFENTPIGPYSISARECTVDEKKLSLLEVGKPSHKNLILATDFEETQIYKNPRIVPWTYALGDGSREQKPEGIFFTRLHENLLAPATFAFKASLDKESTIRLIALCSDGIVPNEQVQQYMAHISVDQLEEIERSQKILDQFNIATGTVELDRLLAFRILALFKFGMNLKNQITGEVIRIPEAGAWWFRTPWLRDVYEGLFNNLSTLLHISGQQEVLRKIILATVQYQDPKSGRLPNKIPEFESDYLKIKENMRLDDVFYQCADATLLFVIVTNNFIKATGDTFVASEVAGSLLKILESFENGSTETIDGQPVIDSETGLLLCVPSHTWTDTQYKVSVNGKEIQKYPLRVPMNWVENSPSQPWEISNELHKPKYYLPEINAQWILTLESMENIFDILVKGSLGNMTEKYRLAKNRCSILLRKAKANFKRVFWNAQKGFLFNIVSNDLKKQDAIEGSPALVAAALVSELFTEDDLAKMWAVVRDSLLVKRKPIGFELEEVPFGVLAKNSSQRIYYGDRQYHEAVVWPRDTPYLIKLLMRLNMHNSVEEILLNNLDHQMSECALFFNNELFSLAEGKNPYPNNISSKNPVPVKNPIQWWSHWVDPFADFYQL